ncbi:MAG: hypothetical protein FIB07_17795 [Candidatus Methanoperedens sp.]|nr:hypothetical protein [Candidatus Methanoperedens sp.]
MLETTEERVKLLKAGFTGKEIEELYIANNNFKIIRNILYNKLVIEKETTVQKIAKKKIIPAYCYLL